jgi:phosphatidate cytidylyltransferase
VPTSPMLRRVASAAVLIPLVMWLTLGGPAPLFHAVVVLLAAGAAWELGRMFERAGRATHGWLDPVLAAVVAASFVAADRTVFLATLSAAVLVTLAVPVWRRIAPTTEALTTTLLAVTYIGWLLGHAILVRDLPGGGALVLLLLGASWAGDSAAYFVGSTMGRRKLVPVVATIVAVVALRLWLAPEWSAVFAVLVGAALGVIGQLGDLAESVIKRSLKTKDTGGLIPGHGGVLDRLDSLLFNVPAFYYLVKLGGVA